MFNVKIYGAGSIGNHLAHGCRGKNWQVTMVDRDPSALARTRNEIYPARYGKWDETIQLAVADADPVRDFDLVIVGTPPHTHLDLALHVLKTHPPRALLVEKPMATPDLKNCQELVDLAKQQGTQVFVGYNHTLTPHTVAAAEVIGSNPFGTPQTLTAEFREHWGGIFGAHPWLRGPQDTYLGFWSKGGGASGEHSHAINIWQHFAHLLGKGRIVEVQAMLDMVKTAEVEYDRVCQLSVRTENGLMGNIVQDVVTEPSKKAVRVQFENGFVEWQVNIAAGVDGLRHRLNGSAPEERDFSKTRPDDFKGEIDHLEQAMIRTAKDSPISIERGLDTMLVVAAAHLSHREGRTVKIDYSAGYSLDALR